MLGAITGQLLSLIFSITLLALIIRKMESDADEAIINVFKQPATIMRAQPPVATDIADLK